MNFKLQRSAGETLARGAGLLSFDRKRADSSVLPGFKLPNLPNLCLTFFDEVKQLKALCCADFKRLPNLPNLPRGRMCAYTYAYVCMRGDDDLQTNSKNQLGRLGRLGKSIEINAFDVANLCLTCPALWINKAVFAVILEFLWITFAIFAGIKGFGLILIGIAAEFATCCGCLPLPMGLAGGAGGWNAGQASTGGKPLTVRHSGPSRFWG